MLRKYTQTHEWIHLENKEMAIVGMTHQAQEELGEIVYVELPKIHSHLKKGEEVVVLESTKAAADVYTPISGTVLEVNAKLQEASNLINHSAENLGWLFKMKPSNPEELEELLDEKAYLSLCRS